ncbi:MAG: hypothetical protein ABSG56_21245 [Bryobacteraceae bacterium]
MRPVLEPRTRDVNIQAASVISEHAVSEPVGERPHRLDADAQPCAYTLAERLRAARKAAHP